MTKIPFTKYSSCGNNFVVVDMTETAWLSEAAMSEFAYQATNMSFGVGCDNLLVLQKATSQTLSDINDYRRYWRLPPDLSSETYIFRMFEPDGQEALCCGNGLMCIAQYLYQQYGLSQVPIITEVPFLTPKLISIGTQSDTAHSWAEMGFPRKLPPVLVTPGFTQNEVSVIESFRVSELDINGCSLLGENATLSFVCYLSFTGEPHLVIFPDVCFEDPAIASAIFKNNTRIGDLENDPGSQLVHAIGHAINRAYHSFFPYGISVNFTRIKSQKIIENRCFERGIYRETLACGTGAMAAAFTVQQLFSPEEKVITVLPHRCRWHDDEAVIKVQELESGWRIQSNPILLFEGVYHMKRSLMRQADKQHVANKEASTLGVTKKLAQGHAKSLAKAGTQCLLA
ncbi:hypothetical protein [Neptunomonas phycophila]|uniref:hypothetical protein n=1 Tax=Neptunomonas phycophila TaxID=1572645 RepID=UPI000948E3A2|nr:hypothetical protein [Neptunomonas phycophila]